MMSTRNKENSTTNNNKYCFGCFILIIGIIITVALPSFAYISGFLIAIGVILLIAICISESGDTGKRSYTTVSSMHRRENCPTCGKSLYVSLSGDKRCYYCGYKFLSESRQISTISDNKVEEPKKSSDVQLIPPISDLIQGKETSKPITSVSELKTEEKQTASSTSEKKIEKSFTTCPHCRQKLPLRAKFCAYCGQKVDVLKPIPPISGIKETNGQTDLNWLKHQYYDLGRSMQDIANELGVSMIRIRKLLNRIESISEKKEIESITDVPPLKTEELQPTPSVIEIRKEPQISPAEEAQPIPPVLEIKEEEPMISLAEEVQPIPAVYDKKEEKRKKEPRACKFCGMRLPKNKAFCLQCGMIIKIK